MVDRELAAAAGGAGRQRLRDRRRRLPRRRRPHAGLEPLEGEAATQRGAVLVSGHRGFDYEELLTATLALQRGASLFATSRDPTLPMPGGDWPGTGCDPGRGRDRLGRHAEIGGKPERHLFDLARERCRRRRSGWRWSATGSPPTSRAGGARGWTTILVLSGASCASRGRGRRARPDHMIEDLAGAAAMRRAADRSRPARAPARLAFAGVFGGHLLRPGRGRRRAAGAAALRARAASRRQHRGRRRDRLLRDHRPAAAADRRPLRRPPRAQPDGAGRLAPRRHLRLPLPAAASGSPG